MIYLFMSKKSIYWRTEPILSPCEIAVMKLVSMGFENKEIASLRGVSINTIKSQVTDVLRKLNAMDRTHATAICIREGIIE